MGVYDKITCHKQYIKDRVIIDNNGCWIWQLGLTSAGYASGRSDIVNGKASMHRVSYRQFVGNIPKDKMILHSCDNKVCVNPKHLRIGTHQDNMDDMKLRNRHNSKGTRQYSFNKHGWVITPIGKFKTIASAALAESCNTTTVGYRINSKNYPQYYRKK